MKKHKHSRKGLAKSWHRFEYKHTTAAILAIGLFVLLLDTVIVQTLLQDIVNLGYAGILIAGFLFVSFFTAVPALVVLLAFGDSYNPLVVALLAGFGGMLGDLIILRYAEDNIGNELKPAAKKLKLTGFLRQLHRKRYRPITSTIGAIIIASPLPDEIGLALLGLSKISTIKLILVTLMLNSAGILVLLLSFG